MSEQKLLSVVSMESSDCVTAFFGTLDISNPQQRNAENLFSFFP